MASEFFLIWPFIVGIVNSMKLKRRERFRTSLKGTLANVVRELVKFFHLQGFGYPINLVRTKTLLKMSVKSNDDIHQLKVTMSGETKTKIAKCRKEVARHNKGLDKPIPLCYVDREKSGVERDDDKHNLFFIIMLSVKC